MSSQELTTGGTGESCSTAGDGYRGAGRKHLGRARIQIRYRMGKVPRVTHCEVCSVCYLCPRKEVCIPQSLGLQASWLIFPSASNQRDGIQGPYMDVFPLVVLHPGQPRGKTIRLLVWFA